MSSRHLKVRNIIIYGINNHHYPFIVLKAIDVHFRNITISNL